MSTSCNAKFSEIDFGEWLEPEAKTIRQTLKEEEGYTFGRPFVFVSEGRVFRRDGDREQRGLDITESDIDSILAVWQSGDITCALDWEHDEARSIGHVAAMWKVEHKGKAAIAAIPAYNVTGTRLVAPASHLWSSPHIRWAGEGEEDVFGTADTGEPIGRCCVGHIAICVDPAQSHRVLTAVRLSDGEPLHERALNSESTTHALYAEDQEMEEMQAQIDELKANLAQVLAFLEEMKAKGEDEPEPEPEAEPEGDAEDEMSEGEKAMKAELAEVRKQLAEQKEAARLKDREARISALFSDKKATQADRGKAERLYDRDPGLFAEIYEDRPAGFALIKPKGDGRKVDVDLTDDSGSLDAKRDKLIRARMSADKVGYHVATRSLINERHALFTNAGE